MQIKKFIPSFQKQSTKESTEKNIRRKFRNMKKPEIGWDPFIRMEIWQEDLMKLFASTLGVPVELFTVPVLSEPREYEAAEYWRYELGAELD